MLPEESAARRAEAAAPGTVSMPAADPGPAPRGLAARIRSLWNIRFLRFLFVAGINTVFGYSFFAALVLLGIHYPLAAAIGTVAGILFNFQTTRRLVFESHDLSLIFRFFAVYGITYVVGISILRWAELRGIPVLLTSAVLAIPMGFFSYTLQKLLVFRTSR
jgi:putative flippase GtrA